MQDKKHIEFEKRLQEPFPTDVVKWRVGITNEKKQKSEGAEPVCIPFPYLDARDIMNRLDQVCGVFGWQLERKVLDGTIYTGIGIQVPGTDQWVWRWEPGALDSGDPGESMNILGVATVGIRRAGAAWGIGRYLYYVSPGWVPYDVYKKEIISPPRLEQYPWALPYARRADNQQDAQPSHGAQDFDEGTNQPAGSTKSKAKTKAKANGNGENLVITRQKLMEFLVLENGVDPKDAREWADENYGKVPNIVAAAKERFGIGQNGSVLEDVTKGGFGIDAGIN